MPAEQDFLVHVYPNDCDAVGHVNHAHMLRLLERARWAVLERTMTYEEYGKSELWAVVRKVEALYNAQVFAGDDLSIRTGLASMGKTSFVIKQEALKQSGTSVCEASFVYVTVSPDGKPIPVPERWQKVFPPWG